MMFLIQIRYIQYSDQLYLYRPTQENPDSGIRRIFACGIRNPGLWNPEFRIPLTIRNQNPSSSDKVRNPVPGIQNPWLGIQHGFSYMHETTCTPSLRRALGLQVVLEGHPSLHTLSSSRLSATSWSISFDFIFVGTT